MKDDLLFFNDVFETLNNLEEFKAVEDSDIQKWFNKIFKDVENKKSKLGICGEHGGDPKSIKFCSDMGLNYVSCSPYRVPIARLAAAQAELSKKIN